MANAIDRYFAADCLKAVVDEAHKQAKLDAEDYLAELRDANGTTSMTSQVFGEDAGEYHYGRTRAKQVVEYSLTDRGDFELWLEDNAEEAVRFIASMPEEFAESWFAENGEVPDGISRVEFTQPPMTTAPKIYKGNRDVVKEKLSEGGNMLLEANRLLLGDGE